jgi:hypothetical protein
MLGPLYLVNITTCVKVENVTAVNADCMLIYVDICLLGSSYRYVRGTLALRINLQQPLLGPILNSVFSVPEGP